MKCIISPRATFIWQDLIEAWLKYEDIKKMLIFKGMSQDEINLIDIEYDPSKAGAKKKVKKSKQEIVTDIPRMPDEVSEFGMPDFLHQESERRIRDALRREKERVRMPF